MNNAKTLRALASLAAKFDSYKLPVAAYACVNAVRVKSDDPITLKQYADDARLLLISLAPGSKDATITYAASLLALARRAVVLSNRAQPTHRAQFADAAAKLVADAAAELARV